MELGKHYEAFKEILDDQIKKIVKKGDITPQELDSVYKASAIILDMETEKAMKQAEKQQGQQSQQGQSNDGSYGSYNMSNRRGSYNMGQSNHYPWFMYQNDGQANNMGNSGNSYAPIWNQGMENKSMHEMQSNDNSNERGRSNRNSRNSYENTYEAAYDGSYDGAYDASNDASNDNSYRRGRDARGRYTSRENSRDRGYSRAMDRERMIGKLEDMMDDAPSEKERRALQQCVTKLEQQ